MVSDKTVKGTTIEIARTVPEHLYGKRVYQRPWAEDMSRYLRPDQQTKKKKLKKKRPPSTDSDIDHNASPAVQIRAKNSAAAGPAVKRGNSTRGGVRSESEKHKTRATGGDTNGIARSPSVRRSIDRSAIDRLAQPKHPVAKKQGASGDTKTSTPATSKRQESIDRPTSVSKATVDRLAQPKRRQGAPPNDSDVSTRTPSKTERSRGGSRKGSSGFNVPPKSDGIPEPLPVSELRRKQKAVPYTHQGPTLQSPRKSISRNPRDGEFTVPINSARDGGIPTLEQLTPISQLRQKQAARSRQKKRATAETEDVAHHPTQTSRQHEISETGSAASTTPRRTLPVPKRSPATARKKSLPKPKDASGRSKVQEQLYVVGARRQASCCKDNLQY